MAVLFTVTREFWRCHSENRKPTPALGPSICPEVHTRYPQNMNKQNVQESKISTDCTSPSNSPRLSRSHKTTVPSVTALQCQLQPVLVLLIYSELLLGKALWKGNSKHFQSRRGGRTAGLMDSGILHQRIIRSQQEVINEGPSWCAFVIWDMCVASNILFKILKPQTPPLPVWLFGYRPWAS